MKGYVQISQLIFLNILPGFGVAPHHQVKQRLQLNIRVLKKIRGIQYVYILTSKKKICKYKRNLKLIK